jgi:CHASE2 domain-containing sensor protein
MNPPPGPAAPPAELAEAVARTGLAWRRTVLSGAVVALLAARPAIAGDARPGTVVVAALALGGCAGLLALARHRRHVRPAGRIPVVAGLLVLGYAVLGASLLLT